MTTSAATSPVERTARPQRGGLAPIAALAGLYILATVLYALLARRVPLPLLFPDEGLYGQVAQSVAAGDGLALRGIPVDLTSTLYIYLIAPAWKLADGSEALGLAQAINAMLVCLTAIPVWVLARRYVGDWPALVPAALVLGGSWMLSVSGVLTENAAMPLAAACLTATVIALDEPQVRRATIWAVVAVVFAALAAFARAQLALLFPLLIAAAAIDCARLWPDWRARLRTPHLVLLGAAGLVTLIGVILVVASPVSTLGVYERFRGGGQPGPMSKALKDQLTGLLAMGAVLPVVIVAGATFSRAAWRDTRLGPLLTVTWTAVVLFLLQSAWALTTFQDNGLTPWHIQRYTQYALPPLLVTMTVVIVWRRVALREMLIAGGVATLVLLAVPGVRDVQEERGLFGIQERVNSILGTSAGVSLALVSALLVGVAWLALTRLRERPEAALAAVAAALVVVFLVQAQILWPWQNRVADSFRAGLPSDLAWIDDEVGGDVARLVLYDNPIRAQSTEFFNYDLTRTYLPPQGNYFGRRVNGLQCEWSPNDAGYIEWGAGCGPPPTRLLLDNDYAKLEFHDQKVLAQKPGIGRVIELTAAAPQRTRLRSVLRVPCGPAISGSQAGEHGRVTPPRVDCFPLLAGNFWLDGPARLELRFRGGAQPQQVSFSGGARVDTIKPRTTTTLRFPIPAGASGFQAQLDWQRFGAAYPELVSAKIVERGGSSSELLY